jgi:hypothetical protein
MSTPLWLQALIGFGGAVVGGAFVVWAGSLQWRRDRRDAKADRSQMAAKIILGRLMVLAYATTAWFDSYDTQALSRAKDDFIITAIPEVPSISDDRVGKMVATHMDFAGHLVRVAASTSMPGRAAENTVKLAKAWRLHAATLAAALTAHIRGDPLAPYQPPDLANDAALIEWKPN